MLLPMSFISAKAKLYLILSLLSVATPFTLVYPLKRGALYCHLKNKFTLFFIYNISYENDHALHSLQLVTITTVELYYSVQRTAKHIYLYETVAKVTTSSHSLPHFLAQWGKTSYQIPNTECKRHWTPDEAIPRRWWTKAYASPIISTICYFQTVFISARHLSLHFLFKQGPLRFRATMDFSQQRWSWFPNPRRYYNPLLTRWSIYMPPLWHTTFRHYLWRDYFKHSCLRPRRRSIPQYDPSVFPHARWFATQSRGPLSVSH